MAEVADTGTARNATHPHLVGSRVLGLTKGTSHLFVGCRSGALRAGCAVVSKMISKYVSAAVGGAAGIVGGLGALERFIILPFLRAALDTLGTKAFASSCANLHGNHIPTQESA